MGLCHGQFPSRCKHRQIARTAETGQGPRTTTGAVVTDYKFGKIDGRIDRYYRNLERTQTTAQKLSMELIPCVMPIGYSNSILQNNPNLAAGLPVKDCPFVIREGVARVADGGNLLPGGGFEKAGRHGPEGWSWVDGFGKSTHLDRATKHGGASSLRMSSFSKGNEVGNCRVVRNLKLEPWRQYRMTAWIKTKGVLNAGDMKAMPLASGGLALNHMTLGVKPTQDWTRHQITFNSQDRTEVKLYLGIWSGQAGTIWIDDLELREVGGGEPVASTRLPRQRTERGRQDRIPRGTRLREVDGSEYGGACRGRENTESRKRTPPIRLTKNSHLREGQRLRVSFHPYRDHLRRTSILLPAEKELFTHLSRQVELLDKYFKPDRYFMQHDELRVAGHCQLCRSTGKTSGQLLADNARRCVATIRAVNPKAEILVWSDMFDPHHNARANYYLVNGTLANSWEGLDKSGRGGELERRQVHSLPSNGSPGVVTDSSSRGTTTATPGPTTAGGKKEPKASTVCSATCTPHGATATTTSRPSPNWCGPGKR